MRRLRLNIKYLTVALILLLLLLQYRLWFSPGGMAEVDSLQATKQSLLEENRQLRERNASLTAEVIDLKQGLQAVEERARSELGMIGPDEVFYRIVNGRDTGHENLLPAAESAPAPAPQ